MNTGNPTDYFVQGARSSTHPSLVLLGVCCQGDSNAVASIYLAYYYSINIRQVSSLIAMRALLWPPVWYVRHLFRIPAPPSSCRLGPLAAASGFLVFGLSYPMTWGKGETI